MPVIGIFSFVLHNMASLQLCFLSCVVQNHQLDVQNMIDVTMEAGIM